MHSFTTVIITIVVICFVFTKGREKEVTGLIEGIAVMPCAVDLTNCGELDAIIWSKNMSNEWKHIKVVIYSDGNSTILGDFVKPDRTTFSLKNHYAYLELRNLNKEDEGTYKCEVYYAHNKCRSDSLTRLYTLSSDHEVFGYIGESADMPCAVDIPNCGEVYSILWFKKVSDEWKRVFVYYTGYKPKPERNFANPDRATFSLIRTSLTSHLIVDGLTEEDKGMYKCDVTYTGRLCPSLSFTTLYTLKSGCGEDQKTCDKDKGECRLTCDNYKKKVLCRCKEGFVRKDGECVDASDCHEPRDHVHRCNGSNMEIVECGNMCHLKCDDYNRGKPYECRCKDGFVWTRDGTCVEPKDCPVPGPYYKIIREPMAECSGAHMEVKERSDVDRRTCNDKNSSRKECRCKIGYEWTKDMKCVERKHCPA